MLKTKDFYKMAGVAAVINKNTSFFNSLKKYYQYYLLAMPAVILYVMFRYIPMIGILIAFKNYEFNLGILGSQWVGLKWFRYLFINDDFVLALKNTIIISAYRILINFPAPIALALLLNEVKNNIFKKSIQTIVYLPHFISWVILGGITVSLLSPSVGLIKYIGLSKSPLMDPGIFRGFLIFSDMWKDIGWGTVVYLAAIATINPEIYEAAIIDGANRLRQVQYITLPGIANTIIVLLILRTGHVLDAGFDQIFILYNPLVYSVSDILDTYVYRVGLTMGRFSLAAAAGLFKSVVGVVLILITNSISKRFGNNGII